MCYIYTNTSNNIFKDYKEISTHLRDKAQHNSDGFTLLFLGDTYNDDLLLRTMSYQHFENTLKSLKGIAGQVFIHLRFATTSAVGLGYTHGFDNQQGVFFMHNGCIRNSNNLAVDSFNLIDPNFSLQGETFANIFEIDTDYRMFQVYRKTVGTLYTDNKTGFATNVVGNIKHEVPLNYYNSIKLEVSSMRQY